MGTKTLSTIGFITDEISSIVGIFTGIVGIALALYSLRRNVIFYEIEYQCFYIGPPILHPGGYISPPVRTGCVITLWNSGPYSITKDKIYKPVTIDFGKHVALLKSAAMSNPSSNVVTTVSNHGVEVRFDYLDKGDGIKMDISYSGDDEPYLNAAIAGCALKKVAFSPEKSFVVTYWVSSVLAAVVFLLYGAYGADSPIKNATFLILLLLFFVLFMELLPRLFYRMVNPFGAAVKGRFR